MHGHMNVKRSSPCNETQLDAIFILSLFLQSISTGFGHFCSPSSGGVLCVYIYIYIYIHNNWYVLYIYSTPPDNGLKICPKHVEINCRNKLRINSASSWFSLHGYIEMHGQQNIKGSSGSLFLNSYDSHEHKSVFFFYVVPCILLLSKFLFYQMTHKIIFLKEY